MGLDGQRTVRVLVYTGIDLCRSTQTYRPTATTIVILYSIFYRILQVNLIRSTAGRQVQLYSEIWEFYEENPRKRPTFFKHTDKQPLNFDDDLAPPVPGKTKSQFEFASAKVNASRLQLLCAKAFIQIP